MFTIIATMNYAAAGLLLSGDFKANLHVSRPPYSTQVTHLEGDLPARTSCTLSLTLVLIVSQHRARAA